MSAPLDWASFPNPSPVFLLLVLIVYDGAFFVQLIFSNATARRGYIFFLLCFPFSSEVTPVLFPLGRFSSNSIPRRHPDLTSSLLVRNVVFWRRGPSSSCYAPISFNFNCSQCNLVTCFPRQRKSGCFFSFLVFPLPFPPHRAGYSEGPLNGAILKSA